MNPFEGTLLEYSAVDCVLLTKVRTDDPTGGYNLSWRESSPFNAAWEFISAPEVTVAEQQGVSRVYRIYVPRTLDLDYHEVFRRTDTGDTYRVTNPGLDRKTPLTSQLDLRLIEVEKWDLIGAENA